MDCHIRACHVKSVCDHHLVVARLLVKHIKARRTRFVIASRGDPQFVIAVFLQPMQIDAYGNLLHLLEVDHLNHRDCIVIVWSAVASGIGYIHIIVDHLHFLRLIANGHLACHGKRRCVDLEYRTLRRAWVDKHRSDVGADIRLASMETHIAAVWDVDLSDAHTAACIHNFHFVRAVDHHIKFRPINAYVVAHVAELLHHCRIFLGIEIARIKPCVIVVIIKAALV